MDSPQTLARGQRRLASLITDAVILSAATLYQVINTQERLVTLAAASLADTPAEATRASLARATATTLGAAATSRAALVTTRTSLNREDPAPVLQNREIARYLRTMGTGRGLDPRTLTGALDGTSGVLEAAATSASASTLSGKWLTSDPVQHPAAGAMGAYPLQRAADTVRCATRAVTEIVESWSWGQCSRGSGAGVTRVLVRLAASIRQCPIRTHW